VRLIESGDCELTLGGFQRTVGWSLQLLGASGADVRRTDSAIGGVVSRAGVSVCVLAVFRSFGTSVVWVKELTELGVSVCVLAVFRSFGTSVVWVKELTELGVGGAGLLPPEGLGVVV